MSRSHVEKVAPRDPGGRCAPDNAGQVRRRHAWNRAWVWAGAVAGAALLGSAAYGILSARSEKSDSAFTAVGPDAPAPKATPPSKVPEARTITVDEGGMIPVAVPSHDAPAPVMPPRRDTSAFVDCSQLGTQIVFFKNPPDAFRRAKEEKKLVFFIHLSGNFEDDAFT